MLDDASPLSELTPDVLDAKLHLFRILDARPRQYLPYEGLWGDQMFTASNPPMGAYITYWLRDRVDDDVSVTIENSTGRTVRTLTGAGRPGLNRVIWDLQADEHERMGHPDSDLGQVRFVPAGEYTATVTCGDHSASGSFTVLPAPDVAKRD